MVTASYGGIVTGDAHTLEADAIAELGQAGALFVASAGNGGWRVGGCMGQKEGVGCVKKGV